MPLSLLLELLIGSCHLQLPQLRRVRGTRKLLLLLLQATGGCLGIPCCPSKDGCKWPRAPCTCIWLLLLRVGRSCCRACCRKVGTHWCHSASSK